MNSSNNADIRSLPDPLITPGRWLILSSENREIRFEREYLNYTTYLPLIGDIKGYTTNSIVFWKFAGWRLIGKKRWRMK